MKILVTGGGGFIGSHLVDLLLAKGSEVTVLDNFSTGKRENLPASHPRLQIVQGDIRDSALVSDACSGVDVIVHLAAVASVQASVDDPLGTHAVNLVGTINLLEAARSCQVKRFVFASSAAVYGDVQTLPVSEETALKPLTPYAADKLASEHYLDFYRRKSGLEIVAFRFFNIFGPRQDPSSPYSGVISIFMQRAIAGLPITVFGDGQQSRDFVYVADLAALLARAVEIDQLPTGPVNVGLGQQTNLLQLLDMIQAFSSATLQVSHEAARVGDILRSLADNRKLVTEMDFSAQYSIEKGLQKTYEWYLQQN